MLVWANSGEDKITRDELRAHHSEASTRNSVWDGAQVALFAARNESTSLALIIEAPKRRLVEVSVALPQLTSANGQRIDGRSASRDGIFDYVGRNIELFYVRYLPIKGISTLAYHHYDERHVPRRFRRPTDLRTGAAEGTWRDRPDHDKEYPDIAVPLELHPKFDVPAGTNQAVWFDIYVPKHSAPGKYTGAIEVRCDGTPPRRIPVVLDVLDFTLPDLPAARTMLHISNGDINRRFLGEAWPHDYPNNRELNARSRTILDQYFQLAHRHRISLIDDHVPIERLESSGWIDRLSGDLFTPERGYDGPGVGVGNNVYCIGAYSTWPWKNGGRAAMHTNADAWVDWFDNQKFATPTDYFLYLLDESNDFQQIETWMQWLRESPGAGRRLRGLATLSAPDAAARTPLLSIACSTMTVGESRAWVEGVRAIRASGRTFWMYNGFRPASGTFTTEDDGVAPREIAWGQFKMDVPRWFVWEGAYYNNFHGGQGETNVFRQAHTFGSRDRHDPELGDAGWNYNNGDGVLFYPGTDVKFPDDNYGVAGPFASLRLKHWRRGLQDFEYLTLARHRSPVKTDDIVRRLVPRILWEVGIDNRRDPTYVHCDISWPTDPDLWEAARKELAAIITAP